MKVFVTGGTGFVGNEVVRQLVAQGYEVAALVRSGSEDKLNMKNSDQVKIHLGDVTEPESLPQAIQGCDAVVHLVGIIREFPEKGVTFKRLHVEGSRNVIEAASAQGVVRYLHMSANGARKDGTDYYQSKLQAEQILQEAALDWTIFRPSLIFGRGGEFVEMLADLIRKLPVVPVIGDGQYRIQSVSVHQVAETYVKALTLPETAGQIYHLGGSKSYTYDKLLDLTGKALVGKDKVHKIHQPISMVKPMVKLLEGFDRFPLTQDQLTMLLEGNECDIQNWAETFSIKPISYAEGIDGCFNG